MNWNILLCRIDKPNKSADISLSVAIVRGQVIKLWITTKICLCFLYNSRLFRLFLDAHAHHDFSDQLRKILSFSLQPFARKIREEIAKTVQFAVRTVRDQFTAEQSWSSNFKLLILFFSLFDCHKPRAISFLCSPRIFLCANKNVKIYCLDISFTEQNLTEKIEIEKFVLFVEK